MLGIIIYSKIHIFGWLRVDGFILILAGVPGSAISKWRDCSAALIIDLSPADKEFWDPGKKRERLAKRGEATAGQR
jgi:hypothetical protein